MRGHTAVRYLMHKTQELACCMDLAGVEELHMDFAIRMIENHSSYMEVECSLMTMIRLDCLVMFPMEHNRPGLESHNSDSMQLPPGVVLRTHYTS